jgi:Transposase and inactivated derivatives
LPGKFHEKQRWRVDKLFAVILDDWIGPIACMWRFVRNNGITEGFHRKMKLIQRRAYGFRNFENYRLRVIAQCG